MNKLKYISSFQDRHGKIRWRFRRKGYNSVYINGEFGSVGFLKEYSDAMEHKLIVGESKVRNRSISDLIVRYYNGGDFKNLSASTQTVYRRILGKFRIRYGELFVSELKRKHIRMIIDKMSDTPTAANRVLSLLSIILDIALDLEWITINHARSIKKIKHKTTGFKPWSTEDLKQFEDFYPTGSRERIAYSLYLYTGQRGIDVVRMGLANLNNDTINFTQSKTGKHLRIPLHPNLQKELSFHKNNFIFMLTMYGKSFSTKGFQQWFSKISKRAGLENCTGHGLRKTLGYTLADSGCTAHEIQSVTGHVTLKEVSNYTKAADQERLARQAISNWTKGKTV